MCPGFIRLLTFAGDTQEMDGEYLARQSLQATLLTWQFRNGGKKKNPNPTQEKSTDSPLVRTKHYLHPAVVLIF